MAQAEIGLIGLAVMGANLALNIAEKGFSIAVHNRSAGRIDEVLPQADALKGDMIGCRTPEELVASLKSPRSIIIMVKAGQPVDDVIDQLLPLLAPGDTLIDAGNANFHDTRRRLNRLKPMGFGFIGMGVSGGEEGARHGPSIMVGGTPEEYARLETILQAIAAKFQSDPCVDLMGPDGAGHFVKTVHNGIEYADMQMIAEVYGYLRDQGQMQPKAMAGMFQTWNKGPLKSYLIEINGKILATTDPDTGQPMVDVIEDRAGQKGTGRWTLIEALTLGQSASTIEAAVGARSWSSAKQARLVGEDLLPDPDGETTKQAEQDGEIAISDAELEQALLAAKIIAYSQGFSLLSAADQQYGWDLDLARIAEIWREGCIIRSAMLDDMAAAARSGMPHGHLIFSASFAARLASSVRSLRRFVASSALHGLATPAMSSALAYYDTMRRARGTTNLIQAQRDFFGAHGFERLDGRADQHGPWQGQ